MKQTDMQIVLAVKELNNCMYIIDTESGEELFDADYILDNYPFDSSFDDFISEFTSELEDCITSTIPYYRIRELAEEALKLLEKEHKEMIDYLKGYIKSKDIIDLILNLLISYKTLVLLHMKGELNEISKKTIIDLKRFANYIINYSIKDKVDLYEEQADLILKDLDSKISDFLCKFIS